MTVYDPIFIVGTPRSGTTLTAKILGRHSRLFMPGETHFFDDIYARRHELGTSFDEQCRKKICERLRLLYGRFNEPLDQLRVDGLFQQEQDCTGIIAGCHSYAEVYSTFMETQMRIEGKLRWGNNVPKDLFNIEAILEFYPHAKIVVCVRDVRDFLLSYKGKWRATAASEVERLKKLYHPVVTSLLWRATVNSLKSLKALGPKDNLHIIPYESLVTRPRETIQALCSVIGERFEEQMLDVDTYASSHGDKGRGIFATSIGRWRKGLSAEEVWIAQRLCITQMQELGYEPEATSVNYRKLCTIALSTPNAFIKGMQANRDKRGPALPYLTRRIVRIIKG